MRRRSTSRKSLRASARSFSLCLLVRPISVFCSPSAAFHSAFGFSATLLLPRRGAVHSHISPAASPTPLFLPLNLHICPRLPQPRAASFKSLYRKRAIPPCSCPNLAHSRFRYSTKTYRDLAITSGQQSAEERCYNDRTANSERTVRCVGLKLSKWCAKRFEIQSAASASEAKPWILLS